MDLNVCLHFLRWKGREKKKKKTRQNATSFFSDFPPLQKLKIRHVAVDCGHFNAQNGDHGNRIGLKAQKSAVRGAPALQQTVPKLDQLQYRIPLK